jgi:hypothetical protein
MSLFLFSKFTHHQPRRPRRSCLYILAFESNAHRFKFIDLAVSEPIETAIERSSSLPDAFASVEFTKQLLGVIYLSELWVLIEPA